MKTRFEVVELTFEESGWLCNAIAKEMLEYSAKLHVENLLINNTTRTAILHRLTDLHVKLSRVNAKLAFDITNSSRTAAEEEKLKRASEFWEDNGGPGKFVE